MLSPEKIAHRVNALSWADETATRLEKDVAAFLEAGWTVPDAFPLSRWSHQYQCNKCSTGLGWNYDTPREHSCPSCGTVETDELYYECWITLLNLKQITAANTMVTLAKAGRMPDGYSRAAELLLEYAKQYPTYLEHGKRAGTGKMQPQSLDEAVWMLQATDLYEELTAAGVLTADQKKAIADNLFAPAIPLLRRQTNGVHNIQTWKACAIAAMALATNDKRAFAFAKRFVQKNAKEGVLANGLWYEVSPGYHYYALEAFLSYEKTIQHYGRKSGIQDTLCSMLDAPIDLMLKGGGFPSINDSSPNCHMAEYGRLYEKGSGLLGGFHDTLAMLCKDAGYTRDAVEALLFGPAEISDQGPERDRLAITQGLVSLRQSQIEAVVKCSGAAGGHDHPDRLTLNLYFPGRSIRAADLGAVGYSNPIHGEFLKRTEAHNTVMVDGLQQPIVNTQRISKTYDIGEALVVTGHYNQAYPGVLFWRKIVLGDGWCLDWTNCSSEDEHLYQWLFHVNAPICDNDDTPLVGDGETVSLIDNPHVTRQRIVGKNGFKGSWVHETGDILKVDSSLQAGCEGDACVFESPDLPTTDTRNGLLMQSEGKDFDLVTLFSLNDAVLPCFAYEGDEIALTIQGRDFVLEKGGAWVPLKSGMRHLLT